MRHILWLLAFVPSMLVAQNPVQDTVVTVIKRTPNAVSCPPCVSNKKDSIAHAQLLVLIEDLKRQQQVPAKNPDRTINRITAITSTLALVGVIWLLARGNSKSDPSWPKDTDDDMKLEP